MISHSKKFIFIHIPKTGGSSIEIVLKEFINENCNIMGENTYFYPDIKHYTATELLNRYGENKFNDYLKFCVIRNPWDRLLSLYYWGHKKKYDKKLFIEKIPDYKTQDCDLHKRRDKWSVNKYICDKNNNLLVDKIITFDKLEEGFNDICKDLDIQAQLPHKNKSLYSNNNIKTNYKEIMDDEVIEIIRIYYKKEIEKFWPDYI